MGRDEIRNKIQTILADVLDLDDLALTDATVAQEVPDWDSTNHVRLIVALESELGIRFEADEISAPENVGALVDLVADKLPAKV